VLHEVFGDEFKPLLGADQGLKGSPFGFQLLLPGNLFAFGGFLEILIEAGLLLGLKLQLGKAVSSGCWRFSAETKSVS